MDIEEKSSRKYDLEERLIDFAVKIIQMVESLPETKTSNHLGNQLLRSGTSPALNYGEAQGAESKRDFIHKFGIILKELRESLVCLKILKRISYLKDDRILVECGELVAIFNKSIITARKNNKS